MAFRKYSGNIILRNPLQSGRKEPFFDSCSLDNFFLFLVEEAAGRQIDGYVPGQDYPIYSEIPQGLSFTCDQRLPGYYSDPEAQCQVWHWCLPSGQKFSFLCPNGTVFNQFVRVCDWWFNVDCAAVPNYYGINEDLYRVPPSYKQNQDHWIALIVLIASVVHISCLVNSSASFYLNEVADFDDIVELDNEKEKVNFEELSAKNPDFEAPEEEGPDPLKINLIEAPSRVKTDVRGVQNKLLNSPYLGPSTHHSAEQYKHSLGQFPQPKGKLNIFESPLIYEVQDDNPQQGYFLVKQRKSDDQPKYKKSGKGIHEGGGEQNLHHNMGNVLETESQQPENCVEEKLDQKSKTKLITSGKSNISSMMKLFQYFVNK
ncbi:unnamed protein product [Phaedon cochleariae]|uniref:Chitin-binding type-2 domain-containing protein n=1 Tax=Phaedon cochleariae TaxID=80249 RepID=A0A9N9S9B3_PHACE|nr:unnamed protein product [Phaedon cochleariae]